jgi:SAM-dependent methyltransferase
VFCRKVQMSEADTISNTCFCGGRLDNDAGEKWGYRFGKCERCASWGITSLPSDHALKAAALYSGADYFASDGPYGYAPAGSSVADAAVESRLAEEEMILAEARSGRGRKAFDIGCGTGELLDRLAASGRFVTVGMDLNPHALEIVRQNGHRVVSELPTGEQFSVVTMLDVVEHLPDPRGGVEDAWRLVEPGGLLVLATPDGGSLPAARAGTYWSHCKPPEHWWHLTTDGLSRLLQELTPKAKFRVEHTTSVKTGPPALSFKAHEALAARLGDGRIRRTPVWPVSGLAFRALAVPRAILDRLGREPIHTRLVSFAWK